MASSKPKKGFSMSLIKPKASSSSSATAAKGGDRAAASTNKPKPSAIGVAHNDAEDDGEGGGGGKRDYVTGIGGGRVVTKEVVVERGPRVIALASNPWANSGSNAGSARPENVPPPAAAAVAAAAAAAAAAAKAADKPAPEKSLDQLAAEAIVRESRRGDGLGDGVAADGYGLGLDSDRVIGMVGKDGAGAAAAPPEPAAGATLAPGNKKRTGLLEQNMIPGLMDVDGEDAKFRHDLGHRAEDLSARSKAYVDVPVAEFGAALLRGMGWKGPEGEGGSGGSGGTGPDLSKDIEPRHHRLGLGAQPKPPEEMKRPRKRKPGEKPRASDAERLKMWEKKVQEERSRAMQSGATKPLSVMDVVELSEKEEGKGGGRRPRAMVLKTQGVPGLNKISVRMEETGEKVIVDKSSATRVSEDDLARRPFSDKKTSKSDSSSSKRASLGSDAAEGRRRRSRSRSGSRGSSSSSSSSRHRRERDGGSSRVAPNGSARKRSRSRSSSRGRAGEWGGDERDRRKGGKKDKSPKKDKKKHKKSSSSGSGGGGSKRERDRSCDERPPPRDDKRGRREHDHDGGISTNERKRPRDAQGNGYGGTNGHGVNNGGGADGGQQRPHLSWLRPNIRVRVVHKSYAGAYLGKGRVVDVPRVGQATVRMDLGDLVLEGVKERHLETVLPSRGGKVIVVSGAEKGATGKLLAKNKEKETALVQVYEDLRALTLSLDDVAEFTGALDEDVDDVGY